MKKFSFIGSLLLLAAVVTFLFIGCQKESAVADDQTTTSDAEGAVVKGIDGGTGKINGLISEENASRMAAEFRKQNPGAKTEWVAYSTKDLITYLKVLNNKYKADSVYVTFGIYDKVSAHNPSQVGRTTVFFMGNNKSSRSATIRTDAADDEESSNYLNGGQAGPL